MAVCLTASAPCLSRVQMLPLLTDPKGLHLTSTQGLLSSRAQPAVPSESYFAVIGWEMTAYDGLYQTTRPATVERA